MKGLDSSKSSSHNHRKNSSEVRRHQKRNKLKKRRGRDASLSYSDDDKTNNASKSASSSASYEDRSRSRKKIRKKVRRSSSRDKRSSSLRRRRKNETDALKKSKKKHRGKLSRRDVSVSSLSSDSSRSCSTCRDRSSSSEDSEVERSRRRDSVRSRSKSSTRVRSDGGRKINRISGKTSREKHRRRHRSRSYSSCSGCGSRSHQSEEERWMEESNSKHRKLEAVGRRGRDQIKDENKAEIIQAYDDCPSSRSNDSNDGGRKRESGKVVSPNQYSVSEKKRRIKVGGSPSLNGKEMFPPKIMTRVIEDESGIGGRFGKNDPPEQSEIPASVGCSEVDDLESLLRQKALENFRKFHGRSYPNAKPVGGQKDEDRIFKQSTAKEGKSIQIESLEEAGHKVGAIKVTQNTQPLSISAERISNPLSDAGFSASTLRTLPSKPTEKIGDNASKNKAMVGTLTSKMDSLGDHVKPEKVVNGSMNTVKQVSAVQEYSSKMGFSEQTTVNKNILDKRIHETPNAAPGSSRMHGSETNNVDSSVAKSSPSTIPYTKDNDSNETKDEAKGGSQFEQKTMSVMRGGERVQVSYKVYIPKKAPALARRHLQQ